MGAPLKVLLVEDDGFDAELTTEHLCASRPGSACTVVDTREAFVAALEGGDWDLVLSDFALPAFSGGEALALTRRLKPELPFIFVTGVLGEEHVVDVLKQGATDYVVKLRMERLPLVVDRAMAEAAERRRRRDTERALRESETFYGRLVESLQDYAVVSLCPAGRIRSWNGAACDIFGYTADEALGRPASLLFSDSDVGAFEAQLERARAAGRALDDRWLLRKDGTTFFSTGAFTVLREADGAVGGYAMIARDVTERVRAAQAVETARRDAEQANLAKNRFLAVLSHELRTPLTPLLTIAHLLQKREDLPPQVARLVPMLKRNVLLEARLIDDLLDITSIERGKLTLHKAPLDLHATLGNALEMSREDAVAKSIDIVTALEATRTETVADDARLQQILWNLIRNAVKFTPEGGRIRVETGNPRPGVFVARVTDSGIGIAADALPHIFKLFEQGSLATSRAYGGLGIGLAIARALAQHHGGTLEAASEGTGRGATFTLTLPLDGAALAPAGDAGRAPAPPPCASDALCVLLVEDHADVADSVRDVLESAGYRVHVASSVAAARGLLGAHRYDVLVCDLGLPDGTGHEVLSLAGSDVPALAVSGYGMAADIQASRAAGFVAHIVKPFEPQRLLDAVLQALSPSPVAQRA